MRTHHHRIQRSVYYIKGLSNSFSHDWHQLGVARVHQRPGYGGYSPRMWKRMIPDLSDPVGYRTQLSVSLSLLPSHCPSYRSNWAIP